MTTDQIKAAEIINAAADWASTIDAGPLNKGYRDTVPILRSYANLTPEQAKTFMEAYAPHDGAPWSGSCIALEAVGIKVV